MNRMEVHSNENVHLIDHEEKMMDHINDVEESYDDNDDDDDDDSIDVNANLKELPRGDSGSYSIRRSDSYTSFLTRSERNRLTGKDEAPQPNEVSKRRIKFHDDAAKLVQIIEIDKIVDDSIKDQYWMTDNDFYRIETDIKMTQFRYENSKSGKIPFDNEKNSIRGLEAFLFHLDKRSLEMKLYNHRQSVLREIHQQKMKHGGSLQSIDWEKVRLTSEVHSSNCRTKAIQLGKQDEMDHKVAWGMIPFTINSSPLSTTNNSTTKDTTNNVVKVPPTTTKTKPTNNNKKKMSKNPLLFWKK